MSHSQQPSQSQSQQTQTQDLVTVFKRNGLFDEIRRDLFAEFKDSPTSADLLNKVQAWIDEKVHKNPSFLQKDRSTAAALSEKRFYAEQRPTVAATKAYVVDKTVQDGELKARIRRVVQELYDSEASKSNEAK